MNVNFYKFAKKENSTAQPTGDGTVIACVWKTPSSVQAPVIELTSASLPDYNYCYISSTGRYYYVTGTAYNAGVWELSLRVDVLASFKTDIGSTSMYVERASAQQNGSLIDKMYPLTDVYSITNTTVKAASTFSAGCIVLNVIDGNSNTGTTSYVMPVAMFGTLIDNLMVDTDREESIWDSITQSIKVTTYEPLKYIQGAFWFPYSYGTFATSGMITSLTLGNFVLSNIVVFRADLTAAKLTNSYTASVSHHPQAATRGSFCNLTPYTEYTLTLGPFGSLKLDSAALATASSIGVDIYSDLYTGQGRAIVRTNSTAILANVACQFGVPISMSSFGQYTVGNVMQVIGGAAAVLAAPGVGAVAGAASVLSGIENMEKGVLSTNGSSGAVIDHLRAWSLEHKFYTLADDDNTNNGRPLCTTTTPSTLGSGYIKVQKGVVTSTAANKTEIDSVNAYMEAGFYYE